MPDSMYLQLFLLLNVFLVGVVTAVAVRHALAHFRPEHHDAEKSSHPKMKNIQLPPATRKQLLEEAQDDFQSVLEKSAVELQRELHATAIALNRQIAKSGAEVVRYEMERYQKQLEELRQQTESALGGAQKEVAEHQADLNEKFTERKAQLEARLAEDIAAERQRLIGQIDAKLADAVTSFLMETLPHNVDLGAQSAYLIATLEEHKAELSKEVARED
jgi:F0F1-type ATP synthase membrane subunit b/b'